jgi:hypothetical protein
VPSLLREGIFFVLIGEEFGRFGKILKKEGMKSRKKNEVVELKTR